MTENPRPSSAPDTASGEGLISQADFEERVFVERVSNRQSPNQPQEEPLSVFKAGRFWHGLAQRKAAAFLRDPRIPR